MLQFIESIKSHRCIDFQLLYYQASMKFEEVHMSISLERQKRICITFTSYLTEMHETTSFAPEVKVPPSLPTVRNQIDIVKNRSSAKLEALGFHSRITSNSNTIWRDTASATPCGRNSATHVTNGLGWQGSWGGVHSTYCELRKSQAVHLNLKLSHVSTLQSVNVVSTMPTTTVGHSFELTKQRPAECPVGPNEFHHKTKINLQETD